jgi:antitoxin MazE
MRVSRWGDSLAVRLPRELVEQMRLAEGDEVNLTLVGQGAIGIAKPDTRDDVLARLRALQRPTPVGFRWSRDEANER